MLKKNQIDLSKKMAFALRHSPDKFNLELDEEGWCLLSDLLKKVSISKEDLYFIVNNCDKQRYQLNKEKTYIRANQGHSVKSVNIRYKEVVYDDIPKDGLYHGTKESFLENIFKEGLKSGTRNHVHLSDCIETAMSVADRRKGKSVIIKIDNKFFKENNLYRSENGVYLTGKIDPKFLLLLE